MKLRCLLGIHDWRDLPWFKCRNYHEQWTNPKKICRRCFKEWRQRYVLHVSSAEGPGIGWYMQPQWEGQLPPKGYASWKEYRERMDTARRSLIERAK